MFEYIVAAAIIGIFLWKSGLAKNLYDKAVSIAKS